MKADRFVAVVLTILLFMFPVRMGGVQLGQEVFLATVVGTTAIILVLLRARHASLEVAVVIGGLCVSSLFLGSLLLNLPTVVVVKDVIEPAKPLIGALLVLTGIRLAGTISDESFAKYLIAMALAQVVFSVFVYLPSLSPIIDLYKGRVSTATFNFHYYRFSGTFGYPGAFGMWIVFASLVALVQFLNQKISIRWFLFVYTSLLFGVLFAGARAAVVVWAVATVSLLVISFGRMRAAYAIVLLLVSVPIVLGGVLLAKDSVPYMYLMRGLEMGLDDGSFTHRARELGLLSESLSEGGLMGNGPDNHYLVEQFGPVESGYFYYGYKFGLPGLGYFLVLGLVPAAMLMSRRRVIYAAVTPLAFAVFAGVGVLIGGVSTSLPDQYKSSVMFFICLGMVLGYMWQPSASPTKFRESRAVEWRSEEGL